jgi:hypothetical protein
MVPVQLFVRQCIADARLEANKCKRKPFLSQDVCVMGYLIYTGNNNAGILGVPVVFLPIILQRFVNIGLAIDF